MMDYREVFISRIKQAASSDKYNRRYLSELNFEELKKLSEELSSK